MTFPSNADVDPDPTTQMAWPSSRRNASGSHILKPNRPGNGLGSRPERGPLKLDPTAASLMTLVNAPSKRRLTTKDLIFLSISMAGAQIAWTVELGYVSARCGSASSAVGVSCITECLRSRQIWDAFLVESWTVGAAHVVGMAGGSH